MKTFADIFADIVLVAAEPSIWWRVSSAYLSDIAFWIR
jgi:hypothetical protein